MLFKFVYHVHYWLRDTFYLVSHLSFYCWETSVDQSFCWMNFGVDKRNPGIYSMDLILEKMLLLFFSPRRQWILRFTKHSLWSWMSLWQWWTSHIKHTLGFVDAVESLFLVLIFYVRCILSMDGVYVRCICLDGSTNCEDTSAVEPSNLFGGPPWKKLVQCELTSMD